MMILKKKTIIILTLVVLIVAASYVSTKYGKAIWVNENEQSEETNGGEDSAAASSNIAAEGYFIDAKLGRENERAAIKQDLTSIFESQNTTKEARQDAHEKYMNLLDREEKEMVIENLIKLKNYDDAVVYILEDSVNVTVRAKSMTPDQANVLKNIVCRESKLPATKVTIQPKE